ncbi:hypothetical protein R6Q59_020532 [Mikania micrantha]
MTDPTYRRTSDRPPPPTFEPPPSTIVTINLEPEAIEGDRTKNPKQSRTRNPQWFLRRRWSRAVEIERPRAVEEETATVEIERGGGDRDQTKPTYPCSPLISDRPPPPRVRRITSPIEIEDPCGGCGLRRNPHGGDGGGGLRGRRLWRATAWRWGAGMEGCGGNLEEV